VTTSTDDDARSRPAPAADDGPSLAERLQHVRWIGGGSGAGKSTVATRLAGQHDLLLHRTDDSIEDHLRRCPPAQCPQLHAFAAQSLDERWVTRSPQEMLATFPWFQGEGFSLLLEDLLALPRDRGVLVEGFRLLPQLVAPLLTAPHQAVWLLPSPAFRRAAFASRGELWDIADRTSDPPRALGNLLERDRLFTDGLRAQLRRQRLPFLEVEQSVGEDELMRRTASALGLAPAGDGG